MTREIKILVVDDDRDLARTLRVVLEGAGYRVLLAHDAARGLELAERERPQLIVLDVMMPEGTEGFHFVWTLRQDPDLYGQRVPIVMLTAIHDKTDLRFYPDSGDGTYQAGEYLPVQEFLDKPVDPEQLLERVAEVLRAWAV